MSFGTPVLNGLAWSIPDHTHGDESVAAVGLFRGRDQISAIDYDHCVGLSLGKNTSVSESAMFSRAADTWYAYDVRAINGAGVIGDPGGTAVRLHTDGTGKIEQIPNPPAYLSAVALPGGRARVTVGYSPDAQAVAPTDWQVFLKQLTDPTDTSDLSGLYDTPLVDEITGLSALPFVTGRLRYTFVAPTQADGVYVFGARFRNASQVGNGNNVISSVIEFSSAQPSDQVDFSLL